MTMDYCIYYQATIRRKDCWFFVATFRSNEHVAFDRTLDAKQSIFEFFVPVDMEKAFLGIMAGYQETGLVSELKKLPNRLESEYDEVRNEEN